MFAVCTNVTFFSAVAFSVSFLSCCGAARVHSDANVKAAVATVWQTPAHTDTVGLTRPLPKRREGGASSTVTWRCALTRPSRLECQCAGHAATKRDARVSHGARRRRGARARTGGEGMPLGDESEGRWENASGEGVGGSSTGENRRREDHRFLSQCPRIHLHPRPLRSAKSLPNFLKAVTLLISHSTLPAHHTRPFA